MSASKYIIPEEIEKEIRVKASYYDITQSFVNEICEKTDIKYAERLRVRRKDFMIKQKELAAFVHRSVECISRIECNKNKKIDCELLKTIAFGLNCTPHYLLGLTDDPSKVVVFLQSNNELKELSPSIIFYSDDELKWLDRQLARARVLNESLKE